MVAKVHDELKITGCWGDHHTKIPGCFPPYNHEDKDILDEYLESLKHTNRSIPLKAKSSVFRHSHTTPFHTIKIKVPGFRKEEISVQLETDGAHKVLFVDAIHESLKDRPHDEWENPVELQFPLSYNDTVQKVELENGILTISILNEKTENKKVKLKIQ